MIRLAVQEKKFWENKYTWIWIERNEKCARTQWEKCICLLSSSLLTTRYTFFIHTLTFLLISARLRTAMTTLKVTTTLAASCKAQLSTMSATWSSVASDSPRRSAHVAEYFMVTMSRELSSGKQFCSGYSHGLYVGRLSCFHYSYSWQPLCSFDITFTHSAAATADDNLFLHDKIRVSLVFVQKADRKLLSLRHDVKKIKS